MNRLSTVNAHFGPTAAAGKLTKDSLSVVDNRTGKSFNSPRPPTDTLFT